MKIQKGYKFINLSTNKSFIERCVQLEEEPLAAVEVGEASLPPEPQEVSKEFLEHDDSDFSDGDEFIVDPKIPTRPKWASKTLHAVGELVGDPNDPRRTRSQFESGLCMKDPMFAENEI